TSGLWSVAGWSLRGPPTSWCGSVITGGAGSGPCCWPTDPSTPTHAHAPLRGGTGWPGYGSTRVGLTRWSTARPCVCCVRPHNPPPHQPPRARGRDPRPSSTRRGYGTHWQAVRLAYLLAHPVCEACRRAPATEVDHNRTIRSGGGHDEDNLTAMCKPCH